MAFVVVVDDDIEAAHVNIRRGGRGSRMQERHHGRRYGIQRYGRPVDLVIVAPLSLPPPRPPSSRLPPPRPNAAMALLSSSSSAARANARARAARLTEADVRVPDPGGTTTTARERARAYVHARRRHHDCCRRSRASNSQRRMKKVTRFIVASQRRPSHFWLHLLSLSEFLVMRWNFSKIIAKSAMSFALLKR